MSFDEKQCLPQLRRIHELYRAGAPFEVDLGWNDLDQLGRRQQFSRTQSWWRLPI